MHLWKYESQGSSWNAYRGPDAAIVVPLKATWSGRQGETAEYLGAEVRAELVPLTVLWRPFYQPVPPQLAATNGTGHVNLSVVLPWNREFVRMIEEKRAGRGDMELRLSIDTHYRLVVPTGQTIGEFGGYLSTQPLSSQTCDVRIPVSRESWLRTLQSMGLGAFEVFEVEVRHAPKYPPYEDAIRTLRDADKAFRLGDWEATAQKCRKTCETAFVMHGGTENDAEEDLRKGAAALMERLFEGRPEDPRRAILDTHFKTIAGLRNMAVHGKQPRFQVGREDAELVLTTTIALFRYIGQLLSRASE
jgi:hypothetical protein